MIRCHNIDDGDDDDDDDDGGCSASWCCCCCVCTAGFGFVKSDRARVRMIDEATTFDERQCFDAADADDGGGDSGGRTRRSLHWLVVIVIFVLKQALCPDRHKRANTQTTPWGPDLEAPVFFSFPRHP